VVSRLSATGTALSDLSGGGLSSPLEVAIDESDNVWISNFAGNSVSKFSSSGNPLSGSAGYTGGGLNAPWGITIAPSGNVWVVNHNSNSITALDPSGAPLSGTTGYTGGGLNMPEGIAADQSGKLWVANLDGDSVTTFDSSGNPASGPIGNREEACPRPQFRCGRCRWKHLGLQLWRCSDQALPHRCGFVPRWRLHRGWIVRTVRNCDRRRRQRLA